MDIDPGTICARSSAGEVELQTARSGLTLRQRKLLLLMAAPQAYAELIADNHLEPLRAARDLAHLAGLGLIVLHSPSPAGRHVPAPMATDPQLQPVVLGGRSPRPVRSPRIAMAATLVMILGVAWIVFGGDPSTRTTSQSTRPASPSTAISAPAAPAVTEALPIARDAAVVATAPAPVSLTRVIPAPDLRERSQDTRPVGAVGATAGRAPESAIPMPQRIFGQERPEESMPQPAPAGPPIANADLAPAAPVVPAPSPAIPAAVPAVPAPGPVQVTAPAPSSASPPAPPAVPAPGPVALAAPAPIAAVPQTSARSALQPVSRETPAFPREAIAAGVTSGNVRARVTVAPNGKVTGVDIVDSQPRRVFDRAVRSALEQWRFESGAETRTTDIEFAFSRD
jgi:TonB family protein